MNWQPHLIIGAFAGAVIAYFFQFDFLTILFAGIIGGMSALVPDIDYDSSKMRQIADKLAPLFALFFSISSLCSVDISCIGINWKGIIVSTLAITGLYAIVMTYLKPRHRGITHSISFSVIYFIALYILSNFQFALFGFAGYVSHLLADLEVKLL